MVRIGQNRLHQGVLIPSDISNTLNNKNHCSVVSLSEWSTAKGSNLTHSRDPTAASTSSRISHDLTRSAIAV